MNTKCLIITNNNRDITTKEKKHEYLSIKLQNNCECNTQESLLPKSYKKKFSFFLSSNGTFWQQNLAFFSQIQTWNNGESRKIWGKKSDFFLRTKKKKRKNPNQREVLIYQTFSLIKPLYAIILKQSNQLFPPNLAESSTYFKP